jgi:hypothetical protein
MVASTFKRLRAFLVTAAVLLTIAAPCHAIVLGDYRGDYPDMEPVITEHGDLPPTMTIPRFDSGPSGDSGGAPAPINNLPEPSSAMLLLAGMAALGLCRRCWRQRGR